MADTQKRKKIVNIVRKKTIFPKDKLSTMITKMMTYIRPNWSTTIEKKANTNTKTKQESHIGPKNAKTAQYKNIAVKTQRYRIISDYGKISKIKMQRKIENHKSPQKKSTKIRSKTAETTICKT